MNEDATGEVSQISNPSSMFSLCVLWAKGREDTEKGDGART